MSESLSLNSNLFAFVVNNNGSAGEGAGDDSVQINRGGASDNQNFQHQFLAQVRDVGMQVIVGDALEAQAAAAAPPAAGGASGEIHIGRGRTDDRNLTGNGGGQTSPSSANSELLYSGLYSYHIPTNTWSLLRCDVASPKPSMLSIRLVFHLTFNWNGFPARMGSYDYVVMVTLQVSGRSLNAVSSRTQKVICVWWPAVKGVFK